MSKALLICQIHKGLQKKDSHTKAKHERWEVDSVIGNHVVFILEGKSFEKI